MSERQAICAAKVQKRTGSVPSSRLHRSLELHFHLHSSLARAARAQPAVVLQRTSSSCARCCGAGGSRGELGEGPGVADLQRCWGCHEGIRTTWKVGPWHTYFKKGSGAGVWSNQSGCDPWWRRVTGLKRRISANLA